MEVVSARSSAAPTQSVFSSLPLFSICLTCRRRKGKRKKRRRVFRVPPFVIAEAEFFVSAMTVGSSPHDPSSFPTTCTYVQLLPPPIQSASVGMDANMMIGVMIGWRDRGGISGVRSFLSLAWLAPIHHPSSCPDDASPSIPPHTREESGERDASHSAYLWGSRRRRRRGGKIPPSLPVSPFLGAAP